MDLIYDRVSFDLPTKSGLKESLIKGIKNIKDSQGSPALEVVLDATHGGYVNRNFARYNSEAMKRSYKSFYTPFPKPVLTEHDDERSPIGRVVGADFIAMDNAGDPHKPSSKIRLKTLITDSDAIQKILDGRYMTVSISGKPADIKCSICGEASSFFGCKNDHERGHTYDGKSCFADIGDMDYSEVSFVNKPADQSKDHAATVVSISAVTAPSMDANTQKLYTDAVAAAKGQVVSDAFMSDAGKGYDHYVTEPAAEGGHVHRMRIDPATGNGGTDFVVGHSHEVVGKRVQPASMTRSENGNAIPMEPHTHDVGKKVAAIDSEECPECDSTYWTATEAAEVAAIVAAGDDDLPGDAKLSTEARKKLGGGTFCGPDRSYPVPDCSHGGNAKARATQQVKAGKLSASSAAKIKACANRKMKSMGCGGSDGLSTGNWMVDALIELVNDLRSSYEAELATQKAVEKKQTDALAEADARKTGDLLRLSEQARLLHDAVAKNVIALSVILGKETALSVFSGSKADERMESYKKKVTEFKDISIEDLTNKEDGLMAELTKQVILRSSTIEGSMDQVINDRFKSQQSKADRLKSWWTKGQ